MVTREASFQTFWSKLSHICLVKTVKGNLWGGLSLVTSVAFLKYFLLPFWSLLTHYYGRSLLGRIKYQNLDPLIKKGLRNEVNI